MCSRPVPAWSVPSPWRLPPKSSGEGPVLSEAKDGEPLDGVMHYPGRGTSGFGRAGLLPGLLARSGADGPDPRRDGAVDLVVPDDARLEHPRVVAGRGARIAPVPVQVLGRAGAGGAEGVEDVRGGA